MGKSVDAVVGTHERELQVSSRKDLSSTSALTGLGSVHQPWYDTTSNETRKTSGLGLSSGIALDTTRGILDVSPCRRVSSYKTSRIGLEFRPRSRKSNATPNYPRGQATVAYCLVSHRRVPLSRSTTPLWRRLHTNPKPTDVRLYPNSMIYDPERGGGGRAKEVKRLYNGLVFKEPSCSQGWIDQRAKKHLPPPA